MAGCRTAGRSRPERRRRPGPGDDRQSRAADQAQGGARRRKRVALADLKRIEVGTRAEVIAAAQGGAGRGRGQRAAGAADLRPHQAAHGARFRLGPEARRGDRDASTSRAAAGSRPSSRYDEAVAGYTAEERGVAQASRGQGGRRDRHAQGAGRRTDGQGAAGGAGLSHERRGRRVRVARRAAALAGRPLRCLAALRPARGSGQGI